MDAVNRNQAKLYSILCAICTDGIEKNEKMVVINCGHVFHDECLAKWRQKQSLCPTCRKRYVETTRVFVQFHQDFEPDSPMPVPLPMEKKQLLQQISFRDEFIEELITRLARNEKMIGNLEEQIALKKDHIKKLEVAANDRKKTINTNEQSLRTANAKLKDSAATITELNKTITGLRLRTNVPSAKLNAKNVELGKQVDELEKQIDQLMAKLAVKGEELDRCQKAAAQKNKLIKELREAKSEQPQEIVDLEKEMGSIKTQLAEVRALNAKQEAMINKYRTFKNEGCAQS